MPFDATELERRLAAATEKDTSRGLNYNTLFALVRLSQGQASVCEVDIFGKGHRPEFFSYPIGEYLRCTWRAVDRLESTFGSCDAVLNELGRLTTTSFLDSVIGRMVTTLAGRSPRRMVNAAPANYRAAVSYGERRVEWLGDRKARLVFQRDFMPAAFHRGVMLSALQASDAVRPKVVARDTGFMDSVYEVEWE